MNSAAGESALLKAACALPLQALRLQLMPARNRSVPYSHEQVTREKDKGRALLSSLWDSSGVAGRLELKPYGIMERWPDE